MKGAPISRSSRPLRRGLASVLAVLLVFALGGQATGLRPCPHHGAPSPGASESSGTVPDDGAPAPTRATTTELGRASSDGSDGDPLRPCTCFGTCHTGAAAVAPTVAQLSVPRLPDARSSVAPAAAHSLPPVREPGFLLHLPNAPPA